MFKFLDIKKLQTKKLVDDLNAKNAVLKVKNIEAESQLQKENEILESIKGVMPIKIEHNNAGLAEASEAISEAIAVLQKYYSNTNNSNYEGVHI